jgi:hypothetical protein
MSFMRFRDAGATVVVLLAGLSATPGTADAREPQTRHGREPQSADEPLLHALTST